MSDTVISYLTKAQVEDLLDMVQGVRDRALFTVAYWRGLRASEVGKLRLEDYRPQDRRLFVRRVKGGISSQYIISPAEKQALDAWLKVRGTDPGPLFPARGSTPAGHGISRQRLHNLMRAYTTQLGFPEDRRHFHCLRHSIATHLVEQGMDIMMIRDWLGHRDIASTMVYARVTSPARDKASEALYGVLGGGSPSPPPQAPNSPQGPTAPKRRPVSERIRVDWAGDKLAKPRKRA